MRRVNNGIYHNEAETLYHLGRGLFPMGREGREQGAVYGALLLFAAILYANVTSAAGWVGPLAFPGMLSKARGGGGGFRIPCALRRRDPVAPVPHLRPGMHARGVSTRYAVFENGRSGDDGDQEEVYDFLQQQEEEERPPLEYEGTVRSRADMEFGIQIENIGLEVMVGPSSTGAGRGLFVALNPGVDRTVLPKGTPIGGYSKEGSWEQLSAGDKCVAYAFASLETGVFFEKELMPLLEAASMIGGDVHGCVAGHLIFYDEEEGVLHIALDKHYDTGRYFVPNSSADISVGNLGMFANDLAYSDGCTEMDYTEATLRVSVIELAWRMEVRDGVLKPTWPVVILSRDVAFSNAEPMEVGVKYGWKYWFETRKKKNL